jgi:hypothetical protein
MAGEGVAAALGEEAADGEAAGAEPPLQAVEASASATDKPSTSADRRFTAPS